MKVKTRNRLRNVKRRIERRLEGTPGDLGRPMFSTEGIRVELADKVRAIGVGGIGLVHQLARRVYVLKNHRPYHESDHVLNLAYNALCDGVRLEDIELRRNDEVFLDVLDTERIPDPTTAGDFCRPCDETDCTCQAAIGPLCRGRIRRKRSPRRAHVWDRGGSVPVL